MSYSEEQQYVFLASPVEWLDYAGELKLAADKLFDAGETRMTATLDEIRGPRTRPPCSRPYVLLMAFAIENLVKGLAVWTHAELVANGQLSSGLKSHSVTKIARGFTSIQLTAEEAVLCGVLEEALPYWGRYPVPLRVEQVVAEKTSTKTLKDDLDRLFGRLESLLSKSVDSGWHGPHDMTLAPST